MRPELGLRRPEEDHAAEARSTDSRWRFGTRGRGADFNNLRLADSALDADGTGVQGQEQSSNDPFRVASGQGEIGFGLDEAQGDKNCRNSQLYGRQENQER